MLKKIIFLSVILSQITISCSKNEEEISSQQSIEEQIAAIVKQPYSKLTPTEQKVKLEAEANEMLVQMDKSKTSGAIEAIENLGNLLDIRSIDIFNGKNDNELEDILNVSGVYGIYTWNNSSQIWSKTASTTELKFVFPAKKNLSTNNATLSSKSTSSNIKVKIEDSSYFDYNTNTWVQISDEIYLPNSVDAILTIDNVQAASFAANAKYSGTKDTPDEAGFKIILNDGYIYEISGKKSTESITKSSFSFNGKNLISFNFGSTANIDEILDDTTGLIDFKGKANGLIQLMDNFAIVAEMDITGLTNDEKALDKSLIYPDYDKKNYFNDINTYNLKYSEGYVAAYNKNTKLILVSKKDGTKIADVILRSEKGYSYLDKYNRWIVSNNNPNGGYWGYNTNGGTLVQYYDEVLYLKFNDSTEVSVSSYFSSGFDNLERKFEDFLKAFER
jgi:hypothetical protein